MGDQYNNKPKKPAGKWSQAIIAIESIIYSLAIFVLLIPVYIGMYGYKAIRWIATAIPFVFIWLIEKIIVPVLFLIYIVGQRFFKYLLFGFVLVFRGLLKLYKILCEYWSKINWCAVRSAIRIIAIICIIGSIYTIIDGLLRCPASTVIITGRFFDANGDVFLIHEAIALLMISITAFYNAWAYSKDEEVSFICTHTVGVSTLRKIRNKILK